MPPGGRKSSFSPYSFPDDHLPHRGSLTEWWYFNGHLETVSGKKLSYGFCLFRASPVLYFAHVSLSDHQTGEFSFDRVFYPLNSIITDRHNRKLEYGRVQSFEITGENSFRIRVKWKDVVIDLDLESQRAPMFFNADGIVDMPEGGKSSYYSFTRLKTKGTLQLAKEQYPVNGLSWMDHQWGNFFVAEKGWDWFSIQLDDQTDYNIYSFRNKSGKTLKQFVTVLDSSGQVRIYKTIEIRKLESWKNPQTGRRYSTRWQLILPERSDTLDLAAINQDQEIFVLESRDFFPSYWEGSCAVEKRSRDGRIIFGKAFSEHFPERKK